MRKQIVTNYGSCIEFPLVYPYDISADTFSVFESSGDVLNGATFTHVDANTVMFFLPASDAANLTIGNNNWFRILREVPGGCSQTLPPIWVLVR